MDQIYNTENIYFRFNDTDKSIFMRDKTDIYNETSAYNTRKRPYMQIKNMMVNFIQAGDTSTFHDWISTLNNRGLRMHTYCAMD